MLLLNFLTVPLYALSVAAVKSQYLDPYNDALSGFEQEIKKNSKFDINFFYYDLQKYGGDNLKESIILKNPDLIFTLGTEATKEIKERVKDIPIIFCVVIDPVRNGFVESITCSGNNLTGITMDIPISEQFKFLKDMNPSIHNVGVIFNPLNSDLSIENAERAAKDLGLTLVKKIVSSPKEIPESLDYIKGKVDVLWGLLDPTVFNSNSITYILKFTLQEKIPFLGFSVNQVEAGALLALYSDYKDLGRQAGEIALRIFSGEKPSQIPICYPRKVLLAINLKVAEWIKADISVRFIDKASIVFR